MDRVTVLRATAWLTAVTLCDWPGWPTGRAAMAQFVPGLPPAGTAVWVDRPSTYQCDADGAVYVDRPVTMSPAPGPYPSAWVVQQPQFMQPPTIMQPSAAMQPSSNQLPLLPQGPVPAPVAQPPIAVPPASQPVAFPPPVTPVIVQPPPTQWTIFGDVLWLHPTGVDMAHAQQQDGAVPFGVIGVADPGFDIGFRVGGEALVGPESAVFASYAFFDESTASTVVPPAGKEVGSLVHHPNALIGTTTGAVTANYDIEFQIADAAYRKFLAWDTLRKISVFAGGRFGSLEQNFLQQSADVFVPPAIKISTATSIDFNGGGPMVGIDAERTVAFSGFSVYGRALVAAIVGQFDSSYLMVNTTAGPPATLVQAVWEDDRVVPMLDYELGLAWTGPQQHFRLAVGYMASHWFNAVTTPAFVDAVQADNYVNVEDTISFDGLVGRVEFRW
jgi:hypothetical protein